VASELEAGRAVGWHAGSAGGDIFESAGELLGAFPGGYDPTSWRRWVVDRPWYCVEWTCTGGESGTGVDGTLSVEYWEHYFRGFERGARISARTVDEAVLRMA
jgi:hypothetical protein